MPLQWSTSTTPAFPLSTLVRVSAQKSLGNGSSVMIAFPISLSIEGPAPSDETLLGWYGVLYNALEADGWTADLRFEQAATVIRQIETV